jgi:hypothetical protein
MSLSLRYNIKQIIPKTIISFNPSSNLDDIQTLLEDKFNTFTDIDSYKNITDYIYRIIINSEFLCRGLNPEYILEALFRVDAVVVLSSSFMEILPNGNIFGFALLKFDEAENSVYIDAICSHVGIKGAGEILINEIEKIGRQILMESVHLISVKSAIPFYKKYGYKKTNKSCKDMCMMIKAIHPKSRSKSKSISNSRSKNSRTKSKKSNSKSNSRTKKSNIPTKK